MSIQRIATPATQPIQIPTRIKTTNISRTKDHKTLDAHVANAYNNISAGVAEAADAADLKSAGVNPCGFESHPRQHPRKLSNPEEVLSKVLSNFLRVRQRVIRHA